jgi:hypothetical protein
MYARALHLAGAHKPALHLYPFGNHGFGVCAEFAPRGGFQECCEWPLHAQRFLQNLDLAPGWPDTLPS